MNVWDLFKLDGKVAFVTGGARNLGYDMALALAEAGADVAISARSQEKAEASAKKIADATGGKSWRFSSRLLTSRRSLRRLTRYSRGSAGSTSS